MDLKGEEKGGGVGGTKEAGELTGISAVVECNIDPSTSEASTGRM
jgi:hypothetical protein